MLSYDSFAARVLERLKFDQHRPVNPYDSLYDDVGLDSVQAFELIVIIEAMADIESPPEEMPEIYTMRDAFGYYVQLHD